MPQGETADRTKPALALSGGGFRATLFHIGSIVRLNELGLLGKLERISSVSGGAITAGRLASAWARLLSQEGKFSNLTREVVEPLRVFCTHRIDERAIALGTLSPFSTIGEKLASIYAEELVGQLSLQDLPDKPQFVFNATNLQTGRSVRMQKVRLADYTIGEIRNPKVALATAIAASSAFPPILSPVKIACDTAAWVNRPGAIHFMDQNFCRELVLTDG
jgi:NTE family protein